MTSVAPYSLPSGRWTSSTTPPYSVKYTSLSAIDPDISRLDDETMRPPIARTGYRLFDPTQLLPSSLYPSPASPSSGALSQLGDSRTSSSSMSKQPMYDYAAAHRQPTPEPTPPASHPAFEPMQQPVQPATVATMGAQSSQPLVDDVVDVRKTTTSSLADFAAQMICHFWFSPTPVAPMGADRNDSPSSSREQLYRYLSPLQEPTPAFRLFVQHAIRTTLVSHSVVIVSLLYIYKLKQKNPNLIGGSGSEYRLAATALMLANKFLDDNTYTTKTWSTVTQMNLKEMRSMEVELIKCLDYDMTVRQKEYESWLEMLHGFMRARTVVTHGLPASSLPAGRQISINPLSPSSVLNASGDRGRYNFHPGSTSRARSSSPLKRAVTNRIRANAGSKRKAGGEDRDRAAKRTHYTTPPSMPVSVPSLDFCNVPPLRAGSVGTYDQAFMSNQFDCLAAPFAYEQQPVNIPQEELIYYTLAASPVDPLFSQTVRPSVETLGVPPPALVHPPQSGSPISRVVDDYGRRLSIPTQYSPSHPNGGPCTLGGSLSSISSSSPPHPMYTPSDRHLFPPSRTSINDPAAGGPRHVYAKGHFANAGDPGYAYYPENLVDGGAGYSRPFTYASGPIQNGVFFTQSARTSPVRTHFH